MRINKGRLEKKAEELGNKEVENIEKSSNIICKFKRQRSSLARVYNFGDRNKIVIKFNVTPCIPKNMTIKKVAHRHRLF